MKLDRSISGVLALATAVALATVFACGCSSTSATAGIKTATRAPMSNEAASIPGTTNLMSAQLPASAPRVGKAHLAIDDELTLGAPDAVSDESAPKEARRSDGSHRSGGFGTSK